jgi:transketolase
MALGLRLARNPAEVTVMLGDGELDEGMVWEAAMSASKFRLGNLLAIVDYNNLQLDGSCDEVMPLEPLEDKWKAFGWNTQCIDGHEFAEILHSIGKARASRDKPQVIIARTVKGKGVSFMENECDWHGRAPDDLQLAKALQELEELTHE